MTLVGKVLVLLNAALAVGMLLWAFALWFSQQPTPFASQPAAAGAKGQAPQASDETSLRLKEETDKRIAQIKALNVALDNAAAQWRTIAGDLSALEASYYHHQIFYERQLDELENGQPADQNQPIHRGDKVKRDPAAKMQRLVWKEGRLQYNNERGNLLFGLPLMTEAKDIAGNPVRAIPYYRPEIQQLRDRAITISDATQEVTRKAIELTVQLAGDPAKGIKGLRTRLGDELVKQNRIVDEAEGLSDLLTKNEVDAGLMVRRKHQMEDRVKELKATLGLTAQ